ncbi:hypothetical protein GQ44DRAFT_737341 [Phaeosphaeriaceae sp. PMI808]|nr:hypothetical protein GQ44DRAFT_737341 [Phaeosphaeriaceae sp. PMI808]
MKFDITRLKPDVKNQKENLDVTLLQTIPTSHTMADNPTNSGGKKTYLFAKLSESTTSVILLWGYVGIIVGNITAIPAFQRDFGGIWNETEQEFTFPALWLGLLYAMPDVGRGFGAATAGPLQDRIGRIKSLFTGATVATLSILIMFFSNKGGNLETRRGLPLLARLLQGFGLGMIKIQTLTYISETVPTCLRGASMAIIPAFDLLGKLTGALVIFGVESTSSPTSYLIAIGSQWIFSIAPLVLCFVLPESPAYHVRNKDFESARTSLVKLYTLKNDPDAALETLHRSIEHEEAIGGGATYPECFRGINRRRTGVIIFANFLPPMFGLPLLASVSYFLQQVGVSSSKSLLLLIIGIICGLLSNVVSTWTLSHIRRRRLAMITLGGTSVLWAAMGISGLCHHGGITAYVTGIFMQFVLPYLYNPDAANLKAKTGFVFAASSALAGVITWLLVPEMMGRSHGN